MQAVELKIMTNDLAVSGEIANIVVPKIAIPQGFTNYIQPLIAGFLLNNSTSSGIAVFGEISRELRRSLLYITEVFSTMPKTENLTVKGKKSTRKSTPTRAKSAPCIPVHTYRVRLRTYYFSGFTTKSYEIDKHIEAVSREEAIGKAYDLMGITHPEFLLPLTFAGGAQICTLIK